MRFCNNNGCFKKFVNNKNLGRVAFREILKFWGALEKKNWGRRLNPTLGKGRLQFGGGV